VAHPLMIIGATGFAAALTVAFADFAGDLVDASRARTAADAVALAGAAGGHDAASRLAAENGAVIEAWSADERSVTVTVRIGDAVAEARASAAP
jgi:hypothetical protein